MAVRGGEKEKTLLEKSYTSRKRLNKGCQIIPWRKNGWKKNPKRGREEGSGFRTEVSKKNKEGKTLTPSFRRNAILVKRKKEKFQRKKRIWKRIRKKREEKLKADQRKMEEGWLPVKSGNSVHKENRPRNLGIFD